MACEALWFYLDTDKQIVGPLSLDKMELLIKDYTIKRNTLVWNKSLQDWTLAIETSLKEIFSEVPPDLPALIDKDDPYFYGSDVNSAKTNLSILEAISSCFQKFSDFSGRASRTEYWYFVLFFFLMFFLVRVPLGPIRAMVTIVFLLSIMPFLAVGSRRMHDSGNSGWMQLVPFYNLILLCKRGDKGKNRYGDEPV